MNSGEIRSKFLDFFKDKRHEIVPSAPLVVKDDPTLMFTNAGMNQFKDYFLGNRKPRDQRVADTQKCLRVSGKHNDLEEVGIDTYHHTMFEMLGNWSFGDYFKKKAIDWAWELLTNEFNLPPERMYATVFGGDEADGLEPDSEAQNLWAKHLPENRILFCGKADNFWEMGETGPCGPCSEIHIDLRSEEDRAKTDGASLVNKDHPLVIEIWNLVFIQFNRLASGSLEDLPEKHVDTGMGLERLVMAIQGKASNYDTDVFQPLIRFVANRANVTYGDKEEVDIALRVIVDHIRAVAFAITDGQLPSNNGAGYVIRRILRRAVRYGYTYLGFEKPFLNDIVPLLAKQFEGVFPELISQQDHVTRVIKEEELSFQKTLEKGLRMIDAYLEDHRKDDFEVSGQMIFTMYDTYGFPKDLTLLILRERGFEQHVAKDWEAEFNAALKEQKERSRADAEHVTGDWVDLNGSTKSEFIGYEQEEAKVQITRYREVKEKDSTVVQLVLDKTPFYAESGGQVGDTGVLYADDEKIEIRDTKKENDLIVHFADRLPKDVHATFNAEIDHEKRRLTMNNHSATHLMHAALREVLGNHVEQRGSLVNDKLLRFDFSHFAKMTAEEIEQVERIVNAKIRENIQLDEKRNVPLEEAKEMGAMALFGEKYGERVRVITFDPEYSVELCGGTHVASTGQIGFFKILTEGSIAAGVRRIEAVTAVEAENHVQHQELHLRALSSLMNNPANLAQAVSKLIDENKSLENQLARLQQEQAGQVKEVLKGNVEELNGVNAIIAKVDIADSGELKNLAFQLKNEVENLYLVLGAVINEKPQLMVAISDNLVKTKSLHAGNIIRELARYIQGGGGGQPFFATAGGKDATGIDKALEASKSMVNA